MKYFLKDHKKLCVPPPQSIYLIFGQKELFLSDIGWEAAVAGPGDTAASPRCIYIQQ